MDREATIEAIWTFADFPPGYEVLVGVSQQPLARETMLGLAGRVGLTDRSLVLDAACCDAGASLPLIERYRVPAAGRRSGAARLRLPAAGIR